MILKRKFFLFSLVIVVLYYLGLWWFIGSNQSGKKFYQEKVEVSCVLKFDNLQEKRSTALANCRKDGNDEVPVIFQVLSNSFTASSYFSSYRLTFPAAFINNARFSVRNFNKTGVKVITQNNPCCGLISLNFYSFHAGAEIGIKIKASYVKQQ